MIVPSRISRTKKRLSNDSSLILLTVPLLVFFLFAFLLLSFIAKAGMQWGQITFTFPQLIQETSDLTKTVQPEDIEFLKVPSSKEEVNSIDTRKNTLFLIVQPETTLGEMLSAAQLLNRDKKLALAWSQIE